LNIFRQFTGEFATRYARAYRLRSTSILASITGLPVVLYFLSVIALMAIRDLRRREGVALILTLAMIDYTLLSCLQDNWYYLVYILPALSAAVAMSAHWLWQRGSWARAVTALGILSIFGLNTAVISYRIFHNDYRNRYARAVVYLARHVAPDSLIVGSGELAFDLGFDGRVVDDCRIGYTSSRRPDYIVLEAQYYLFWFPWLARSEPETMKYIRHLLKEDYEKVYDQAKDSFQARGSSDLPYVIYKRKQYAR
jgi:hypothetical protein